jgi:serine/threonine protein kinase
MNTDTGRYTRRHRIATGGMGEVWLAHDEVLHRDIAVKYLKPEYADDEGFRSRFLQEARHAAALLHPGIATVFDFGEHDGTPYLVMEYVEGRPLSDLLADGRPLDPDRVRDLVIQAAEALATAHARGVVHRDVKPGNLLVTPDGTVKVTDFGIARAADGMALTQTGQLIGTPSYLSPEQADGRTATPASDVYSLGVVLFECLTGRPPFTADTPVAIAVAHVHEPVPDLPDDVPQDLAAVTRKALAKDPADRFPDAGAFAAALGAAGAAGPEATMVLEGMPLAPPVFDPDESPARGSRWLWIAGAAVALLVGAAVLVGVLTAGDETDTTTPPGASPSTPRVTSTSAATVTIDPATYVGRRTSIVRAALSTLGLTSRVDTIANPDDHPVDTVASLSPTGPVTAGSTITLKVWGPPEKQHGHHGNGHDKQGGDN